MKKFLVVLLALAVAGGAFAVDLPDGLTLAGEVKAGFGVFGASDGDDDTDDIYAKGWNDDAGSALRARLDFGWEGDIGGTKIRLEADNNYYLSDSIFGNINVALPQAFGWVNLLGSKIVLWGGHGVDAIYGTGGVVDNDNDGGDIFRVEVRPFDGLSVAWGLSPFDGDPYSLKQIFGGSAIGAKFANDTFSVSVSAKLSPSEKEDDTQFIWNSSTEVWDPTVLTVDGPDGFVDILFDIAVPTVLPVGIDISGAFQSGDTGYFRIAPKVTFALDKLDAHVQADLNFDLDDTVATTANDDGYANFGAFEKAGDASIGFEIGAGYQITDIIKAYLNLGSGNLGYFAGNGLYVKPGVSFAFGPNTSIEVFDKIGAIGADDKTGGVDGDYSAVTNQFQVDFVWSF
jgi:hypothetical protein